MLFKRKRKFQNFPRNLETFLHWNLMFVCSYFITVTDLHQIYEKNIKSESIFILYIFSKEPAKKTVKL